MKGNVVDKGNKNVENEVVTSDTAAKPGPLARAVGMAVLVVIGVSGFYGIKHVAHVQNVKTALDFQCKKSVKDYKGVVSADVPWWKVLDHDVDYPCSATLKIGTKDVPVSFVAKRVTLSNAMKGGDDWEVNFGIWGWIGEDYHIANIKAK